MLPTNTELINLARSLAQRVAHNEADVDDLMQEALWNLHLQTRKTPNPRKPWAFAKTIMLREMQRYYKGEWTHSGSRYDPTVTYPLDLISVGTSRSVDKVNDKLELDEFLDSLGENCGKTARCVAENLIMPTDIDYCRHLVNGARCKTLLARRSGASVRDRHVRVSHKQLRAALGLTQNQWRIVLEQVREFATEWLWRS